MAQAKYDENISRILSEICDISKELPKGVNHRIYNRINKVKVLLNKKHRNNMIEFAGETHEQIAKRYSAINAIFNAMTEGRHISLKDSQEFRVSQMHTYICIIRKRLLHNDEYEMKDRWIETANGDRCKEYWLERVI